MDTASIPARIEQVTRHAADGNRLINRQREIIAGLEQNRQQRRTSISVAEESAAIVITFIVFFRNIILKNRRLPRRLMQISCKRFAR
jgi:hypothetical protein